MVSEYPVRVASTPALSAIAALFARDANLTFGGGTATAETIRRELVVRRGWVSDSDFRHAYAASRLTPGTNLLAICAALGWNMRGVPGSLIALLSASVPTALVVTLLIAAYPGAVRGGAAVAAKGATAVSVALLLSSVWALVRPSLRGTSLRAPGIILGSWLAYVVLQWNPIAVLFLAAVAGSLWPE